MKKITLILLVILNYSCIGQKKSSNVNCHITTTYDLKEFDSLIRNIDTTKLFKDVFQNFENTNDGVLLYRLASGNDYGYFTIFNKENSKIYCQKFSKNFNKRINVNGEDSKMILNEINLIEEPNTFYYEQCTTDSVDFIYLLIIKKEGKIISKYLSHRYNDFLGDPKNVDIKSIKNIFEIAYRYSFK
ncbi:hypothetical protein [Flavobacterium poyangense]|uniref:hypothetical protein n=1 Tax=Flavobacterium poyangense TaxID=2204302 RepID=UPI00141F3DAC|nr:hypothetical protein [Flavobacterium sp. JXAS1]